MPAWGRNSVDYPRRHTGMATGTQEVLGTRWGQLPGRGMSGRTQALPVLVPKSWSNFPISPLFAVAIKDPRL